MKTCPIHKTFLNKNGDCKRCAELNKTSKALYDDAIDKKFVEDAKKNHPGDAICGFCGKTNDNADDAGFWYYQESLKDGGKLEDGRLVGPSLPACKACAKILHPVHVKYWGEGER